MTISSTTRKAGPFDGNGVTTSFPFTFKVFSTGDITVVRTMPSGIEETLVLDSDYSVTLNGDQDANPGGTITYPISGDPLPDGWRLTAVGDLDNLQPTDITNGGGFYPQVIENALDRVTMLIQQLEEELGRTIRIAVSDDTTEGLELPAQDGRAARILGFDADGNFTTYERATATVQTTYRQFTATAGQTSFTLPNSYTPGANSLYVWLNGAKLISGTHFTETTATSFTLTTGAQAGDSIEAIAGVPLANGTVADAAQISYTPAGGGAVARTMQEKMREHVSVADYFTSGDVSYNAAIAAMAAEHGYVRFSRGEHVVTTMTIDYPVRFDVGAYLTASAGQTITITERIESDRQWIFRGDGSYSLVQDGNSGEESKQVHASWFGSFPSPTAGADQAPFIQKAINSLGNTREGVIEFDNGNYHVQSAITVNRGIAISGQGTRRTVFRIDADGFDVFTTAGEACRFNGIQFELESPLTSIAYACIKLLHNGCDVYDVSVQSCKTGVYVAANNCRVENVIANYGVSPAAGSAVVHLASGTGNRIQRIQAGTSAFAPNSIVRIGGAGTVSGYEIDDVSYVIPCPGVLFDASAGNILRGTIDGIVYNGSSGAAPNYIVDITNAGANIVSDVTLSGIVGAAYAVNGIRIQQSGSGTLEDIQISQCSISGSSGIGIELARSAGTMRDIFISDTVNVAERATPISYSGTITNVRVSPQVTPSANHAYCYSFSVADDGVAAISLNRSVFTGVAILSIGSTNFGQYVIRAATTPAITAMLTASANVNATTGVLTGTTGADAKATISVDANGMIYVENRLGSAQNAHLTLLAGA